MFQKKSFDHRSGTRAKNADHHKKTQQKGHRAYAFLNPKAQNETPFALSHAFVLCTSTITNQTHQTHSK
jgi:hypothetical protein